MKKEIKFKAIAKFTRKWIFGGFIYDPTLAFPTAILIDGYAEPIEVHTLCQLIGKYNGVELYEGDILSEPVEIDGKMVDSEEPVFYNEKIAAYCVDISFFGDKTHYELLAAINLSNYKIIGNIYDKELFPQEEKMACYDEMCVGNTERSEVKRIKLDTPENSPYDLNNQMRYKKRTDC